MKLTDLGERKLIKRFIKKLGESKGDNLEDDCAFIPFGNQYLLLTSDMIAKKTHLPPEISAEQIGWFIVAINLSDLAAKGGKPLGLSLSVGLPSDTSVDFVERIAKGAGKCASFFETHILGGDTKEDPELTLAGTAIGMVKKENFMARKGADPRDLVCVTGNIGKGGAGLFALKNDIPDKLELVRPLLEPMPRLKEGMALASSKTVSSSMDLSDGLAYSLHLLKEINGCGFEIEMEKIPTSNEVSKVVDQLDRKQSVKAKKDFILYSGGDYELVITVKRERIRQAVNSVKSVGGKLTPIGKVTKENKVVLIDGGKRSQIRNSGYEHFCGKNKTRVK